MTDWTPQTPYVTGNVVRIANPPTMLDRLLMFFGLPRRTKAYRTWRVVNNGMDLLD